MKARCQNEKHDHYDRYGGRGIKVCERWQDFANFLEDLGEIPDGLTIERKDNDGNYTPANVRLATMTEQHNNTSRNRFIEYKGRRQTVTQWAREIGVHKHTLRDRLNRGWPLEKALTTEAKRFHYLDFAGERRTIAEWARHLGVKRTIIKDRLLDGWSVEEALTTKPKKQG